MFKRLTIPSAGMELLGNTTRVLRFSMTEYRLEKLVALGFPIPSFTGDRAGPPPPHGLFSGAPIQVLQSSPIKRVFITDTVSTDRELGSKVEVVSVGKTFGDAIDRIESGESLSALFETE